MTTLLLIDRANPRCVLPQPGRIRTRLLVHLQADELDRALATGVSPDSSAALSLRARTLIGAHTRVGLARSIRTLIKDAQRPINPLSPGIAMCRRKVLRSSESLERLAERLLNGGPVDARGVAQARMLLHDGYGPVYNRPAADDLEPAVCAAIDALEIDA